ncbi:primase C-terminal domain-containing protein [Alkalibacterium sp. s-m-28]
MDRLMTDLNASLSYPLSEREIRKTIQYAYSGRYKGPQRTISNY